MKSNVLRPQSASAVCTIDIIIPIKLWFGQHILRRPVIVSPAIFSVILFERFPHLLEGELADAKPYRYPDGGLRVIAYLHRPPTYVTDIADTCAAVYRSARPRHGAARIHFCHGAVMPSDDLLRMR